MNYFEAFEELKAILEKAQIKKHDGRLAIQVCITDLDSSGIFYIEDFGDRILAEPYDYYDNDVELIGQAEKLKLLFEKKLDLKDACQSGEIVVNGNLEALAGFLERIAKPTLKRTTVPKKVNKSVTTPKTTAKKTKKTEAKKMTEKKDNKNVKPKDSETIKEVVEKEIKPKK